MFEADGEVHSLVGCGELLRRLDAELSERAGAAFLHPLSRGVIPNHIWFRGEPHCPDSQLTPSVFRRDTKTNRWYDEAGLFGYARTQIPEAANTNLFDSLSRLQHRRVATRLLDWSESLGVALFFAVSEGPKDADSWLFLLNARRLNRITGNEASWNNVHEDTDFGTRFRCEFIQSRTRTDWFRRVDAWHDYQWSLVPRYREAKLTWLGTSIPVAALEDHCTPVAVRPLLNHARAVQQRSVFTLHGGKIYPTNDVDGVSNDERLPKPVSFETIIADANEPFLQAYRIRASSKERLLWELKVFGFRHGILFPDSDALADDAKEMYS